MDALSDPVWYVRSTVAWALGQIGLGASKARACLLKSLNDDEIEVRLCAAEALGSVCQASDEKVISALENVLVNDGQPPEVKDKARETLKKLKKGLLTH
jgi:HEAT repeat protein